MHMKTITEKELADLLEESINLQDDPETGILTGDSADVRRFTLIQGGFSTSIVLISEFPMSVMPPDPTPEEIEEFEREFAALRAEFGGATPPTA